MKNIVAVFLFIIFYDYLLLARDLKVAHGVGISLNSQIISIPYKISEVYTIEPYFTIYIDKSRTENEENYKIVSYERILNFGVGIKKRKLLFNNTELNHGFKLGTLQKIEIEDILINESHYEQIEKSNTYAVIPNVGVEYYINDRFSIGSELHINFELSSIKNDWNTIVQKSKLIYTGTNILVHYYFK